MLCFSPAATCLCRPYDFGGDNYTIGNHIVMSWDEVELNMRELQTTDAKIEMVREFTSLCDESGMNIYPYGWTFIQFEQLLDLDYYFWRAAAVSMAVVFGIALAFGMSFLNAGLVAFFSVVLCIEVYGSLKSARRPEPSPQQHRARAPHEQS